MKKTNSLPSDKKRKRLVRIQANTNPNFGKKPEERNVKELLAGGVINLDKPHGPTSHQIDGWIKEVLDVEKVGHGGTLDPNATGVLPIGLGEATKSMQVLLLAGKEYVGIMRLHKDIDKKKISLSESIKKLGMYTIHVKLHPEVTAKVKLLVDKE